MCSPKITPVAANKARKASPWLQCSCPAGELVQEKLLRVVLCQDVEGWLHRAVSQQLKQAKRLQVVPVRSFLVYVDGAKRRPADPFLHPPRG